MVTTCMLSLYLPITVIISANFKLRNGIIDLFWWNGNGIKLKSIMEWSPTPPQEINHKSIINEWMICWFFLCGLPRLGEPWGPTPFNPTNPLHSSTPLMNCRSSWLVFIAFSFLLSFLSWINQSLFFSFSSLGGAIGAAAPITHQSKREERDCFHHSRRERPPSKRNEFLFVLRLVLSSPNQTIPRSFHSRCLLWGSIRRQLSFSSSISPLGRADWKRERSWMAWSCRQHSYSIYHSIQKLKVFSFHEHATAILTSNYCYNIIFNQSIQFINSFHWFN